MATKDVQAAAWALSRRQHFTIARRQLLALGFTPAEIRHRLADRRLHVVWPGVYAVGRPEPLTQVSVNGFRVDFYWPGLRIVVEADSLRFHRTPAQQRRGHERDHAHAVAGLIPLRFTHAQIAYEPRYVRDVLRAVAASAAAG
jgi:hypothetical protein